MKDKSTAKKILERSKAKEVLSPSEFDAQKDQPRSKVKGTTEKIDTKQVKKLTNIDEFTKRQKKQAALRNIRDAAKKSMKAGDSATAKLLLKAGLKGGKKLLSAIPFVGGFAAALASGDASAAVPGSDLVGTTGPRPGSLEAVFEDPNATLEERQAAAKKMREFGLARMKKLTKKNK